MALVLANRVQETTTTTGTGTVTLAGAVAGFQSFAVIGNGNTTYYTITSGNNWEVGIGTYTSSGTTLARTTILSSSAGGAAITLAGTSTVFVTYPSEDSVYQDGSVIAAGSAVLAVANGGSGQTTYTNGQLLIGNTTGNTLTKATLTQGTGISITNGTGSITIASTVSGTVTSVGGTGTVNGITLSGTVTSSGNLTLGGALTGVNLTSQVTGTLPVANGGTGVTTSTGTGSVVRATAPALSGPTLNDGYTEEVFAVTGTTPALSPTNGSIQTWTLSGNSTPTAGTWADGQSLTLMIDDGTARTVTWTSLAVVWKTNGGVAPTLNLSGFTVIQLWEVGSVIYGARVGDS